MDKCIRKRAFWILDAMRHSRIRNAQSQLEKVKNSSSYVNEGELRVLLSYAAAHVPFYRERITQESPISAFPVVNKGIFRSSYSDFRSDEFLNDQMLRTVNTSGSTGTPFQAFQDRRKLQFHQAGLISMNQKIGWEIGAKYLFIRAWGSHFSGGFKNWATNVVPVEATGFNDKKAAEVCEKLKKDKKLQLILVYASSLEIIAQHALNNGYQPQDFGIKLIISDSECLKPSVKAKIKKAFDCPILDRYANNENGIIALTDDESGKFHVNYPEYYVELLKLDSDRQAELGEIGRIVITDLYNHAFPFIRYDTGDLGIASQKCGEQVVELSQLVGRVADALTDTTGTVVGEAVATDAFEECTVLRRYQLVQDNNRYLVRVEKPFSGQETELIQRARFVFGSDANISVEYVDVIPCGKNGKFKTMIKLAE